MPFNIQFNATQVAPNLGMEPVPTGTYTVEIVKTEEIPLNGKPGTRYRIDMQVLEPVEYKGKIIFESLNCKHENPQTSEIAYGTLSAICHVIGLPMIGQSSQEMHNRPFKVSVKKQPRNDDPTKDENKIAMYMDMAGNPPKAGGTASIGNGQATASQAAAFAQQPAPAQIAAPAPTPTVAPAGTAFPPEGWIAHPTAPGYFYKGQEVLTEAQLREKFPAPAPAPIVAAPVAPAIPAAPAPTAMPSWAT